MKVSVYGAGYVGLVTAACLASLGHEVCCVDINEKRIELLNQGDCPIYEKGLPELLSQVLASKHLFFTANALEAIDYADIHFIATGTPGKADGSADLSQVFEVARQIAENIQKDAVIVTKSTVPVGTGDGIAQLVEQICQDFKKSYQLEVVSNPEFLREGSAVYDFLNADRIVIGGDSYGIEQLCRLYQPLVDRGVPLLCMNRQSAELTKYASNAMLACRISFMNQISNIAESVGANIEQIKQGMGLDHRIGPHFLNAGIGYGGSCFPKDTRALIHKSRELSINASLLEAIDDINNYQKEWVIRKLNHLFKNDLSNKVFAVWGLSFKPGTDDMRDASSLVIIDTLIKAGAQVNLYDPVAMEQAKKCLPSSSSIRWFNSAEAAIEKGIDALIIATEWDEFKLFPLSVLKGLLPSSPIIDGRNCYTLEKVKEAGICQYVSVGRPVVKTHLS